MTETPMPIDVLMPRIGRVLFAAALVGFGVLHVTAGDFVTGRAPAWPDGIPGRAAWAWSTGLLLIGAAAALITGRHARPAVMAAATVVFMWALLRNVLPTIASPPLSPQWTNAGKALVLTCGALAVAGTLPASGLTGTAGRFINGSTPFLRAGASALGLFMVLCGIQHFMYDRFVASLVPDWIPGPLFWTYTTGVALVVLGLGLLVPRTARACAALSGTMIFSWVWLVHVPRIASHGAWLPHFEALALAGLGFLLWRVLPTTTPHPSPHASTVSHTERRPEAAGSPPRAGGSDVTSNRESIMRGAVLFATAALTAALSAGPSSAQQGGTITGIVTAAGTQRPLDAVQVSVVGTRLGAVSNPSGIYTIADVPAGTYEVRATLIGYGSVTQSVTVQSGGSHTADLQMREAAVQLEELFVTATGSVQRRREVGNVVGNINVADVELAAVNSVSQLLNSRTPGLTVLPASGTTGTSQRIRIRGTNSVSLSNEPLIIIDGVRVNSASESMSMAIGGQTTSRLNDLNPDEIERIEVLKGPSAAAMYGTAAANGVIQITTRRGSPGGARWEVYTEAGYL